MAALAVAVLGVGVGRYSRRYALTACAVALSLVLTAATMIWGLRSVPGR